MDVHTNLALITTHHNFNKHPKPRWVLGLALTCRERDLIKSTDQRDFHLSGCTNFQKLMNNRQNLQGVNVKEAVDWMVNVCGLAVLKSSVTAR